MQEILQLLASDTTARGLPEAIADLIEEVGDIAIAELERLWHCQAVRLDVRVLAHRALTEYRCRDFDARALKS